MRAEKICDSKCLVSSMLVAVPGSYAKCTCAGSIVKLALAFEAVSNPPLALSNSTVVDTFNDLMSTSTLYGKVDAETGGFADDGLDFILEASSKTTTFASGISIENARVSVDAPDLPATATVNALIAIPWGNLML